MTLLIQFLAILVYVAGVTLLIFVFNVLAVAVYLWVDERFRGGRAGGGAIPQAPPRASTTLNVRPDSDWWLR